MNKMKSFFDFYHKVAENQMPTTGPGQQGQGTAPPVPPDMGVMQQISQLANKLQDPKAKQNLLQFIQQQQKPQQGQVQQAPPKPPVPTQAPQPQTQPTPGQQPQPPVPPQPGQPQRPAGPTG